MKGFRLYHHSEYFREKRFFHPDSSIAEKWIRAVQDHAHFFDVTKKYERIRMLGKGKFSTVYLCRSLEGTVSADDLNSNEEFLAMKLLDKK